MRTWQVITAVALAASSASAGDHEHKFLHNDISNSHCWGTFGTARGAPAMTPKTPGAVTGTKSPGLSLLGDGISAGDPDPQVAVSPNYVLVLTTGSYVFYDRATNKQLAATGCVPMNAWFSSLFAPVMTAKDGTATNPAYINDHLELGGSAHFKCDATDKRGCVTEVYDARAYYDYDTNRFWIVAAARNTVWTPCKDEKTCKPACGNHQFCNSDKACANCSDDARRFMFVAVSKAEDPRKGFWEYVLVRDYADWPLFAVRNNRLVLGHSGAKRIYVFDSKKLIGGATSDPFLGQYLDDKFSEADKISTVTQYSDADGLTLILGRRDNDLTVYAFKDPTKPLVKKTHTLGSAPSWTMQPVYRYGKFYFAADDSAGHHINVHRVTATLDGSPVTVGALHDEHFTIKPDDAHARMPGVLVEETGAFIVWYAQFPNDGSPAEARYKVMYANESTFREPAVLRASHKKLDEDTFVSDEEIGGAAEPGKVGFWITHFYTNNAGTKLQVVGKVDPGCGTQTLCGSTCVDLSVDETSCGACGKTCGREDYCAQGTCKKLTIPSCPKCVCYDGFTTNACHDSQVCEHVCRGHEPH